MTQKYRTQVLLEKEQYYYLKNIAQRENISISEALRRILEQLTNNHHGLVRESLLDIEGIGEDRELDAKDHDSILYRKP